MNRGAGRRVVFRDDDDRRIFVHLLGEMVSGHDVEIHGYCLVGNHYHLIVRSTGGELSAAMQQLGQSFTRWANARRGVDGPIFRGRFHSVRVDREGHLVWLHRYVNSNARDAGWTGRLADYPWSGLACALGGRPTPSWLSTDFVMEHFGSATRFEAFVSDATFAPDLDRSTASRVTWEDVEQSCRIASAPGPGVHSRADVLAVSLAVAAGTYGISTSAISALSELSVGRANERVHRSIAKVAARPELSEFAVRTNDVLRCSNRSTGIAIGA